MASKLEMLEEMTVRELKCMARDNGISGYSNKRKSELIDLIDEELTESEVRSWLGGDAGGKSSDFNLMKIGVAVIAVAALVGFTVGYIEIGPVGSSRKEYVNENLGFSITYPSSWVPAVDDLSGTDFGELQLEMYIIEKVSENEIGALYSVTVENRSDVTLENIRDQKVLDLEMKENASIISGPESQSVDGAPAFEIFVRRVSQSGGIYRTEEKFIQKDNFLYILRGFSLENRYDDYKSTFNRITESFNFLE